MCNFIYNIIYLVTLELSSLNTLDEKFGDQKFSEILKQFFGNLHIKIKELSLEFQKISDIQIFHLMYISCSMPLKII